MKELLNQINAYLKGLKLTERLIVMSDGEHFVLFYQSTFNPAHSFEETGRTFYFERTNTSTETTIQQLTHWVDKIIEKPRD